LTNPSLARRWVRFADAHRRAVLAVCLIAGAFGAAGTVLLYSDLRPDIGELLPANARSARDLDEVSSRVGGWAEEAVVLSGADRQTLERFSDDLAKKLAPYEPAQIRWIEYRLDDLSDFFGKRAWLFPSQQQLQTVRDRIGERIKWERLHANPLFVSLDDSPAPSLDELASELGAGNEDASLLTRFPDSYLAAEVPGHAPGEKMLALAMLVRMAGNPNDFKQVLHVDGLVRRAVDELQPSRYAPGLRADYGGYVASNILEHDALAEDLVIATLAVLLAVALSLVLYFRSFASVPLIGVPLGVGTLATFGIAWLKVGHLNSNTAFLGSIVVGNGINFSIILLARYLEERRRGRLALEAMGVAVESTWLATLTASLAAGIAYGSLMATEFRGFNQFGFIGLVGMASCWLAGFAMLPPLALAWEARRPLVKPGQPAARPIFMEALARLVERAPGLTVALGLALSAAAAFSAARFARDPIEQDFAKLRDARALLPGGPGWWDARVDAIFGEHLTPNVFLCRDEQEARQVHRAIEESRRKDPHGFIGSVTSIASFVPTDQEAKLPLIAQIRALATPSVLARLPPEKRAQVEKAVPPADLAPFSASELPRSLLQQITETDGRVGTPVLVYPSSKVDVWDGRDISAFARELRAIPQPRAGIPVASPLLIFADVLDAMGRDGLRATVLSFCGALLLVVLSFLLAERSRRSLIDAAWVIGSMLVGVLWFAGLAGLLGLKLNMLNFIAVPITFGIGVDYATNVFQRRRQERSTSIADCLRTTGGAVALCSLTTIIGYSSLLVARNQALNSFGWLANVGEVACLAAALIAMPALLRLRERRKGPVESAPPAAIDG
jgi:predicted RND superfamily exporter protein